MFIKVEWMTWKMQTSFLKRLADWKEPMIIGRTVTRIKLPKAMKALSGVPAFAPYVILLAAVIFAGMAASAIFRWMIFFYFLTCFASRYTGQTFRWVGNELEGWMNVDYGDRHAQSNLLKVEHAQAQVHNALVLSSGKEDAICHPYRLIVVMML